MEIVSFVEIDGVWHELTDEQDETVCGLDFDLYTEARKGGQTKTRKPAVSENRCPTCFAKR